MTQEAFSQLMKVLARICNELESIDGRLYELVEATKATNAQETVVQLDGKELARAVTKHQHGVIRNSTGVRSF